MIVSKSWIENAHLQSRNSVHVASIESIESEGPELRALEEMYVYPELPAESPPLDFGKTLRYKIVSLL